MRMRKPVSPLLIALAAVLSWPAAAPLAQQAAPVDTFREIRRITVTDGGQPVDKLNELEYIRGEIYANVWQTNRIARISPQTGRVLGWIDLTGLLGPEDRQQPVDVLNGI